MPAETTTGAADAQGATAAQPHGGASQAQGAEAQSDASAGSESSTVDVVHVQRKLAELERDNAKYRGEARQREEAQRKADEAKLSDAERSSKQLTDLTTENATLKQQLQSERVRSAVISAATRLGFADPGDAFSLLDQGDIVVEDGHPKGVDKALKDLLTRKPYLASSTARATGSVTQGVQGGSAAGADMNTLIRQAAGRH